MIKDQPNPLPIITTLPPVVWAMELMASNNGYPLAKVVATLASTDAPVDRYTPSIALSFPARPHCGQSFEAFQRAAIAQAQACIRPEALLTLLNPP